MITASLGEVSGAMLGTSTLSTVAITDADDDVITVTATTDDPSLITGLTITPDASGSSLSSSLTAGYTLNLEVAPGANGDVHGTITASDGSVTVSDSFAVTVPVVVLPETRSEPTRLAWMAAFFVVAGAALSGIGRRRRLS
jgi:hypothetical protein